MSTCVAHPVLFLCGVAACTTPPDSGDANEATDARDTYGENCTLIGCNYYAGVRLAVRDASGQPVIGYTVHVTDGRGHAWTVNCAAATTGDAGPVCDGSVNLVRITTSDFLVPDDSTTLEIVTDHGATWSGSLASIQAPTHPNGPSCPPACYPAAITITLPG